MVKGCHVCGQALIKSELVVGERIPLLKHYYVVTCIFHGVMAQISISIALLEWVKGLQCVI